MPIGQGSSIFTGNSISIGEMTAFLLAYAVFVVLFGSLLLADW